MFDFWKIELAERFIQFKETPRLSAGNLHFNQLRFELRRLLRVLENSKTPGWEIFHLMKYHLGMYQAATGQTVTMMS